MRLRFDQRSMRGVSDDQRGGEEIPVHHTRQRHLKHRRIGSELQELLGAFRGRHRPKPRAAAARKYDRGYFHAVSPIECGPRLQSPIVGKGDTCDII